MSDQILTKIAEKLGINSTKAIQKGAEYHRLSSARSTLGLSNVSETAKICVALHIACDDLSLPFDKAQAVKLSFLTKPSYLKLVHTLKSLIRSDDVPTVGTLCAALRLPELTQTALDLIKRYEKSVDNGKVDVSLPMYICAAVLAASKLKKSPVDKDRLKETCRCRWSVCQKLAAQMAELGGPRAGRKRRAEDATITDRIEEATTKCLESPQTKASEENEPEDDYETWKMRILQQAKS